MREIRATDTLGGDMFTVQIGTARSSFREEVMLTFHGYAGDLEAMTASTGFMPYDDALQVLTAIITGTRSVRAAASHLDGDLLSVSVRSMIGGASFDYATDLEDGIERATFAMAEVLRMKVGK